MPFSIFRSQNKCVNLLAKSWKEIKNLHKVMVAVLRRACFFRHRRQQPPFCRGLESGLSSGFTVGAFGCSLRPSSRGGRERHVPWTLLAHIVMVLWGFISEMNGKWELIIEKQYWITFLQLVGRLNEFSRQTWKWHYVTQQSYFSTSICRK